MLRTLPRLLGSLALAVTFGACARTEATPAATAESSAGVVATPATPATPAAAATAGTPGTPGGLGDSVSTAADRGRIRGAESAPIWLIEVSDFQCPYCKLWHDQSFAAIDKEYVQTGKVRLAYLNFPLSTIHKNARGAAEAAMCGSVQGKFWPMHASLFDSQRRWADAGNAMPIFDSLAVAAGVRAPAWRQCMSSHATAPIIDADRERSTSAGVQSTPTFFVGDRKLEGAYPADSFRVAIAAAIARARGGR